jgi:hypothetical protein
LDINDFDLRTLQKESARALVAIEATNNNIFKFNQQAHHDSQNWYKAVIEWYINEYGGLPSHVGPGKDVKLVLDN